MEGSTIACVNCWWLTEGWGYCFSSYDQYPWSVVGVSRFQMKILLGLAREVQQMEQTPWNPGPTLLFGLSASVALLYFKLWTWSCGEWARYHQCSDGRDRSDHFGRPGSPSTRRDDCKKSPSKGKVRRAESWWVPCRGWCCSCCQEKAEQLASSAQLRAGSFLGQKTWILPSLGLKGDYQRENAVALEALSPHMEGNEENGYGSGLTCCRRRSGRASRVVWRPGVSGWRS